MWVLIPIKRFALAKTRLSDSVAAPQRAALAQTLAGVALRAALGANGVSRVVALTADPVAQQLASALGADVLAESGLLPESDLPADFNDLLAAAFDALGRQGAAQLAYLASDLPDVGSRCVERFLAAHQGGVSIARAARDGGTNALLFNAPRQFALAFGPNSAQLHHRNALAAGLSARWLDIPGISNDLDTADLPATKLYTLLQQGAA